MKSQLEWLQAVKSGDPARIKRAQINIAHRRAGLRTPVLSAGASRDAFGDPNLNVESETPSVATMMGQTPSGRPGTSGWMTPGTHLRVLQTPEMTPMMHAGDATPSASGVAARSGLVDGLGGSSVGVISGSSSSDLRAPPMGLDSYLALHTSEDNASFSKVVAEEQQRKRMKVGRGNLQEYVLDQSHGCVDDD